MNRETIIGTNRRRWLPPLIATAAIVGAIGLVLLISSFGDRPIVGAIDSQNAQTVQKPSQERSQNESRQSHRPRLSVPNFIEDGRYARRAKAFIAASEMDEDLDKIWERERRDPVWAPQMESTLSAFLSDLQSKVKIQGTSVSVDCRESSCRLDFEFTKDALLEAQGAGAPNPQLLMIRQSGVWAEMMYEVPVKNKPVALPDIFVAADADGKFRKTMILAFGDDERRPERYVEWSKKQPERLRALQQEAPAAQAR